MTGPRVAALIGGGTNSQNDLALDVACLCSMMSGSRFGKRECAVHGDANRTAIE